MKSISISYGNKDKRYGITIENVDNPITFGLGELFTFLQNIDLTDTTFVTIRDSSGNIAVFRKACELYDKE